jgi:hypothetical protein
MTRSTPKLGTTTSVAPADLTTYPRNARQGDVAAIAASLKAHGQYKPVVVNVGSETGRPNEVLAGNHTLLAFRELAQQHPDDPQWANILVHWVNVDDDMAARIVVADNRTSELGGFDVAALAELLDGMDGDLSGLGYSAADMADLAALVQENTLPGDLGDLISDPFSPDAAPRPPRTGEDGLIAGNAIEQDADLYADKATRLVILAVPIAQFIWLQDALAGVRADLGVETNTEAVLAMVAERTGLTPPAADAPAPEAAPL